MGSDPNFLKIGVRPQLIALCLGLAALIAAGAARAQGEEAARQHMVRVIEAHASYSEETLGRDHIDPKVLEVMARVPRHAFVPEKLREYAYADRPLPIGFGQTISQPFIVALMTDLAGLEPDDVVLEIGTGSAYQAAVLSPLAARVYSIEIVPGLADQAAPRLKRLGYDNVETRLGDGYYGWQEAAPFDAILVTAAAGHVPPPLVRQLKPGGRMVIPVGGVFFLQHLVLVEMQADGTVRTRQVLPVRFVPLTGDH